MIPKYFKTNILLLLAAFIWGFAFVAQRKGMEFIHPLTFNGIRFLLGALTLLPFLLFGRKADFLIQIKNRLLWLHGLMAGIALFIAANFQQLGMMYTTAGKGGFITSLYILFVPAFGLIQGKAIGNRVWMSVLLALIGLYLLSVHDNLILSVGDLLVLISALFWAMHLIVLSYISPLHDAKWIAFLQFLVTGVLSLLLAFVFENPQIGFIQKAIFPLLYAGIISAGIGFTLQIAAQKSARVEHAAIILSFEAVFAAVGGFLILNERLGTLQLLGCAMMIFAVVWVQLKPSNSKR